MSRTTVLYYESVGLLKPPRRSAGNYRVYSAGDAARLRQICAYRRLGVPVQEIRSILDRPADDVRAVLERRLREIDAEVGRLREHQRSIVRLLGKADWKGNREEAMTKEKWVSIMRAAGFSEADMNRWHAEFERAAPEEHQEFLEFLHIPGTEIETIRAWSRGGAAGA